MPDSKRDNKNVINGADREAYNQDDALKITNDTIPPTFDLGLAEGDVRSAEWRRSDYKEILQSVPTPVLILDLNGKIKEVNREFLLLTGFEKEEIIEHPFSDFIFSIDRQKHVEKHIIETIGNMGQGHQEQEFLCHKKDGGDISIGLSSAQLKDEDGYTIGIVCTGRDLSDHQKLIQALEKAQEIIDDRNRSIEQLAGERLSELAEKTRLLKELSVTDELTKLYNRRYFFERASEEFQRSKRYQTYFSVVILDIDHFKSINDEYGHQAGDVVLYELAGILKHSVRRVDLNARYGGEEFVIMLPSIREGYAYIFCERLREKVSNYAFSALPQGRQLTVSMGVADFPIPDVHSVYELISCADKALYKAKETRDTTITFSNLEESEKMDIDLTKNNPDQD